MAIVVGQQEHDPKASPESVCLIVVADWQIFWLKRVDGTTQKLMYPDFTAGYGNKKKSSYISKSINTDLFNQENERTKHMSIHQENTHTNNNARTSG